MLEEGPQKGKPCAHLIKRDKGPPYTRYIYTFKAESILVFFKVSAAWACAWLFNLNLRPCSLFCLHGKKSFPCFATLCVCLTRPSLRCLTYCRAAHTLYVLYSYVQTASFRLPHPHLACPFAFSYTTQQLT